MRRPVGGLLAVLAVAAACSGAGDAGGEAGAGAPPETPGRAVPESASADPSADPSAGSAAGAAETPPAASPILVPDSLPEVRTYRLLLVNRRSIGAVVHAEAGAARVVLDTVPRLDSVRVNVEVQALRLRLVAMDRWGEVLAAETIELAPDSILRWEVPAVGESPGRWEVPAPDTTGPVRTGRRAAHALPVPPPRSLRRSCGFAATSRLRRSPTSPLTPAAAGGWSNRKLQQGSCMGEGGDGLVAPLS